MDTIPSNPSPGKSKYPLQTTGDPIAEDWNDEDLDDQGKPTKRALDREKIHRQKLALRPPNPDKMKASREKVQEPDKRKNSLPEVPGIIGAMAKDVARVTQVPLAPSMLSCLALAAASIGKGARLYDPLNDRHTPANLMAFIPATSGSGKSQLFARVCRPLNDRLTAIFREWRKSKPDKKAEIEMAKRSKKILLAGGKNWMKTNWKPSSDTRGELSNWTRRLKAPSGK